MGITIDVALPLTLSKKQRLVRNKDFIAVLAERKRCSDHLLVVHMATNGLDWSRIGISIGRVQGNAVVRNRIKRLIREVFRLNQHALPRGVDILVTMNRPRRHKKEKKVVMSVVPQPCAFSLDAMNESFLKLVALCQKKMWNS